MSLKKIFIWFSVIPVLLSFLNKEITSINFLPLAHKYLNEITFTALAIAGLNCLYILYRNYKTEKSFGWYVFATFMAIIFFGYLWFGYQLSHAGF